MACVESCFKKYCLMVFIRKDICASCYKRQRYELLKSNKIKKTFMTSFKLKINKYINENENLKQFFNEFAKVINNQKDIFILKKLAMENDCKDLMDILCIKRLYHLYFSQYFKDKRVNYTQKNSTSSLFIFFSQNTIMVLRALVGLTRFGIMDYGHLEAVYYKVKGQDDKHQFFSETINNFFNNTYLFNLIKGFLLNHLMISIMTDNSQELKDCYRQLYLDFEVIKAKFDY